MPSKHVGCVVDQLAIHSLIYGANNDIRSSHNEHVAGAVKLRTCSRRLNPSKLWPLALTLLTAIFTDLATNERARERRS